MSAGPWSSAPFGVPLEIRRIVSEDEPSAETFDNRTGQIRTIMHTVPKTRITVTVDEELVTQARSLGVNLSAACERGLLEVTEITVARAELARLVAEFEANGGVYDDKKLARARRVLAEVDSSHPVDRIAG